MFFSIITVCFNDLEGLRKTAASISRLTDADYEWVIVDGNSSDDTVDFIKSVATDNVRWVSERDAGIYDGMNKGVRMSAGRYLIFMNSGDVFVDGGVLATFKNLIENADEPDVIYGGCYYAIQSKDSRIFRAPRNVKNSIWHGLPGMHQATFYRREFMSSPAYDSGYKISADYGISVDFHVRGAKSAIFNQAVGIFELGGTSSKRWLESLKDAWNIQRKILKQSILLCALSAGRRCLARGVMFLKGA